MADYLLEWPHIVCNGGRKISRDVTAGTADFFGGPLKFPATFSKSECKAIVGLARSRPHVVAGLSQPIEDYRTGTTQTVALDRDSRWLYERIGEIFATINEWYRFEIVGLVDALLYCEYSTGSYFHWHVDSGAYPTATRKISLSVQLSDQSAYEGGTLEFAALGELPEARGLGTVISFPSFLHHRVTTVTAGTRRSLVAWAHGPVFR